jgi:hypothetical protein
MAMLGKLELGIFAKAGHIQVEKGVSASTWFPKWTRQLELTCELGPLLSRIADTQFEKSLDGHPMTLTSHSPSHHYQKKWFSWIHAKVGHHI